jgi:cysteine desulfurase/selenocysteine lyase
MVRECAEGGVERAVNASATDKALDFQKVRADFPGLLRQVRGRPVVYLDNAATAQRPLPVIEATDRYYRNYNASVHRGVHALSQEATDAFEAARESLRVFLNAAEEAEVILTKGCTESLNLVASCWRPFLSAGDEILVSTLEHHSNIVPWQLAAEATGAAVCPIPITDAGAIDQDAFRNLLSSRTKIVAVGHISNALGTVNPVKEMARLAHGAGAIFVVDGAQAGPHLRIDVQDLDVDFYSLSGHKMYGPTGVGILYGKRELLEKMPPYQGGGSMIKTVSFEHTSYAALPAKFEPGTPNIAGMIGLGAVVDYLAGLAPAEIRADKANALSWTMAQIASREQALLQYGTKVLGQVEGLRILGYAPEKAAILSFVMQGVHPHDIGTILDSEGIAIRAGHHCAMPLMERLGVPATARASLAFYSTPEELDKLSEGLLKVREIFA